MVQKRHARSHRRVRLGIAIREARKARGWSQGDLASAAGSSQAFVSKLETAAVRDITPNKLDRIIDALGIDDTQARELREFAASPYDARGQWVETSDSMGWWQRLQEIECDAREINTVSLQAHDGLLQSEPYMRRQFELSRTSNLEVRVRARLARQEAVLHQDDPPRCTFVLPESCLYVDMGAPAMMRTQLEHLLTLSKAPHVHIRIVPFGAPLPALSFGFTLLKFASTLVGDFVAVEYGMGGLTLDDDQALNHFQNRWDRRLAGTVSAGASRDIIGDALAHIDREHK